MALAAATLAACSTDGGSARDTGSDGSDASTTLTPGSGDSGSPGQGAPDPAGPETGQGGGPAQSLDELEARWATARAELVETLSDPAYGRGEDGVLRGPGGLEVDLNACPGGWSDTEGLDTTTIRIGHTTAQTGNLASYTRLSAGLQAYLDLVNAKGGIDGRQIELIVRDDGFEADRTMAAVDGLLATERPFLVTTVGSPTSLAVYDTLNAACVPHPFVVSTHPAWADPVNHPWSTGLQLGPASEVALWGAWIEANLTGALPVDVAALVMDNELGRFYEQGFAAWAEAHPDVVASFTPVRHSPTASAVSAEMATVAGAQPEVFVSMTAGRPCALAMEEAAGNGLAAQAQVLFTPSLCRDPATYLAPVGAAADGWRVVGAGVKSPGDPLGARDPFLDLMSATLTDAGLDPADPLAASGFGLFGWAQVEVLRIAAELPGGLSRSNLLLVLRSLALEHPFLLEGVRFAASGTADASYVEGAEVLVFEAAAGQWRQEGPILDVNGTTPLCPWNGSSC